MRALALAVLLASTFAFAQQKKPLVLDESQWGDDVVEGTTQGPDMKLIESGPKRPHNESLIRTRTDFRDKVLRSEADLH